MRRCGGTGRAAVLGGQHLGDPRGGPAAGADQDEGAGDRADHVVQESVGLDVDPDEVVHPVHGDMRDRPDAAGAVGPVGLEAVEVVAALECRAAAFIAATSSGW